MDSGAGAGLRRPSRADGCGKELGQGQPLAVFCRSARLRLVGWSPSLRRLRPKDGRDQCLQEAERMRGSYKDLAARGFLTFDELGDKLAALEETRSMARQELELLKGWRACLYDLKRDRDTVLWRPTARCSGSDPMKTCSHERLLRRP